jgi:hypothetical protein
MGESKKEKASMALQEEILHSEAELLLLAIDNFLACYGKKLNGRSWTPGRGLTPNNRWETLMPDKWIILALAAFADPLASVYEGMPFRQFVEMILSAIPAGEEGQRLLAAAKMRARKRWTNLYEIDCQSLAELLRKAADKLSEHQEMRRNWQVEKEESEEARIHEEIAREPAPFKYQRTIYHFPYRQSLLLSILRDQKARNVPEVIDELWSGLWPRKLPDCKNRLHQLQRDTNAALHKQSLPFQIGRPAPNQIQLHRNKTMLV